MYAGRVVEEAEVREIFKDPLHPYTWGLLGSVPRVDLDRPRRLPTISGSPPSLLHPPAGCHFITRCPHRMPICETEPELRVADPEPATPIAATSSCGQAPAAHGRRRDRPARR